MKRIAGFLITALFIWGCQNKGIPEYFDFGTVKNNVYTNNFLEFKLPLPEGWQILYQKQIDSIAKVGEKVMNGGKADQKQTADATKFAKLIAFHKYKPDSKEGFNVAAVILAENLSYKSGIFNGQEYLENYMAGTKSTPYLTIEHDKAGIEKKALGPWECFSLKNKLTSNGKTVFNRIYVKIEKGFAIVISSTFSNGAEEKEIEGYLNQISKHSEKKK